MKIKVGIADDHALIGEGIQSMLRDHAEIEIIAYWQNGEEVLNNIGRLKPDVILLDISMPGMKGDEIARIISRDFPKTKIITLTNLDNIYFIQNMLQQGVDGYILKNIRREEMELAIKTVYEGGQYFDETIRARIEEENIETGSKPAFGNILTNREVEILEMIARDLSSKEIAKELFLSKRTIDHHRERMMIKLQVKSTAALVKRAMSLGIISG